MSAHAHGPGEHDHALGRPGAMVRRGEEGGRMRWALVITALFMVAEVVGGVVSGSLTLLADAGHMLTDVGALGLSLLAMRLAERPANVEKTFGWVRLEILAALVNGAVLLAVSALIVFEAWRRLRSPVAVDGSVLLWIGALGLVVNIGSALLLHGHSHGNLNVRGAYLHVLGDLLGSLGAVAAGATILLTGWTLADPLISVLIALLILVSAWRLVREATDVLLEAAPPSIDMPELLEDLLGIDRLDDVHDVHVWTLTSGFVALSGHGVIDDPGDHMRVLDEVRERMKAHGIGHVTFQLEMRPLYHLPGQEAPEER
jgi:cobalt-zinc-cadmium efflux system protein